MSAMQQALMMAGSAQGWTPALLSEVKVWIDYTDTATVTTSSGKIVTVTSKGGSGVSAIDPGVSYRPTYTSGAVNGKAAATFDGSTTRHALSNSGGGPVNMTELWRNVSGAWGIAAYRSQPSGLSAGDRYIVGNNTPTYAAARFTCMQSSGTANAPAVAGRRLDADSYAKLETTTNRGTDWIITAWFADYADSAAYIWVNGTLDASTTSFQTNGSTSNTTSERSVTIGAFPNNTGYASADIAHVVLGNGTLSTDARQRIEGYMAHQLGLAANLPSDHPYKSAPPT